MIEAKRIVLKLLEAQKITVDEAATLFDAMDSQTHPAMEQNKCSSKTTADESTASSKSAQRQQPQSEASVEDFVKYTFNHVSNSLKKASQTSQNGKSQGAKDAFTKIEKTIHDVTDKLNQRQK